MWFIAKQRYQVLIICNTSRNRIQLTETQNILKRLQNKSRSNLFPAPFPERENTRGRKVPVKRCWKHHIRETPQGKIEGPKALSYKSPQLSYTFKRLIGYKNYIVVLLVLAGYRYWCRSHLNTDLALRNHTGAPTSNAYTAWK